MSIASVTTKDGERMFLRRRHPGTCADAADQTCGGTAYLLPGDHVEHGPDCHGWSLVTYVGKNKSTTGWMPTGELRPASSDPLCKQAAAALNVVLDHDPSTLDVPLAFEAGTSVGKFPPDVGPDPESGAIWDRKVTDLKLNGKPVKAISYGAGGTCNDDFVELWTEDFKRRIPVSQHINEEDYDPALADPADWGGYSRERIVDFGGTPYFLHFSRSSRYIKMYGFKNDLSSELRCEFVLRPRDQEKIIFAANPELCQSVVAGKVEVLNDDQAPTVVVDEQIFGPVKDPNTYGGIPTYSLSQPVSGDLYNDGKRVPVAIAQRNIESGAGCGHHFQDAWPVVLGADGKPDLSYPPVEAIGGDVHLIRFEDKTYLDSAITDDEEDVSPDSSPEKPLTHEVGQLSRSGYMKMCTLQSRMYVVKP